MTLDDEEKAKLKSMGATDEDIATFERIAVEPGEWLAFGVSVATRCMASGLAEVAISNPTIAGVLKAANEGDEVAKQAMLKMMVAALGAITFHSLTKIKGIDTAEEIVEAIEYLTKKLYELVEIGKADDEVEQSVH